MLHYPQAKGSRVMKVMIGAVAMVSAMIQPAQDRTDLASLAFLVGEWKVAFDAPSGAAGDAVTGVAQTRWGVDHAWIESDFVADASAGPHYAVHIVVAADRLRGIPTAFAVNTLSPVPIVYEGRQPAPDHVVFTGSAAGKFQKVSYRLLDPGHLEFLVEEATASEGPWKRHSRAVFERRS